VLEEAQPLGILTNPGPLLLPYPMAMPA
jgi:hypothetical protein